MQMTFEFVATSLPEPLNPTSDLWNELDEQERSAAVEALARLMIQALQRKEMTDECS